MVWLSRWVRSLWPHLALPSPLSLMTHVIRIRRTNNFLLFNPFLAAHSKFCSHLVFAFLSLWTFLTSFIFSNISKRKTDTILIPSASEWGGWRWSLFRFGGIWLQICNVSIPTNTMFIFFDIYIYIYKRWNDAGRSFESIFMKFTWLVRVHSWVNPIVLGNNWPNRTTYIGENMPPKSIFRVSV